MEWICTITFKIRAKIEVKQHLYRFHFKLGALPHPDGLLVSGLVLHLTSVVFMALILGEFAYMYKLAVFCNLVTIVLNNMLCYMYLRIKSTCRTMKQKKKKKIRKKKERDRRHEGIFVAGQLFRSKIYPRGLPNLNLQGLQRHLFLVYFNFAISRAQLWWDTSFFFNI